MSAVVATYRFRVGLLALVACVLLLVGAAPAGAAEGDWPSFRPGADNNAVVSSPTPTTPQHTAVRWTRSLGSGWDASPTPPILADGKLIVLAGRTVYELDPATGATIRSKQVLAAAPSFAYTPPTYADGVIYAPLSGGIIQAIDATTLESLWTYRDDLGGQNWTAPLVKDGLVYGGFYTSDTGEAHFVCLRAKASDAQAAGSRVWSYTAKGGFYWSNPLFVGSSVIVGTGDGTAGDSGTGHVVALDRETGAVTSDLKVAGDVHATPVYDAARGYVLFTTTSGWLYRAQVNAETGALTQPKRVRIGIHCTTTPVLYDGRAYVGTSEGFSAGKLVCVGETSMDVRYQADLDGPMQSSPLLSTAQLPQTGEVTLYCTINNTANGLKAVTVAPDATSADQARVSELYDECGHEQYGICSPIAAADGAIFYKNDSGTLFALEPTDDAAHANVVSLIQAIGPVDKGAGSRISAARKAYDALSAGQRAAVPNYGTLKRAEQQYAQLTRKAAKAKRKAATKKQRAAKKSRAHAKTHKKPTRAKGESSKRAKPAQDSAAASAGTAGGSDAVGSAATARTSSSGAQGQAGSLVPQTTGTSASAAPSQKAVSQRHANADKSDKKARSASSTHKARTSAHSGNSGQDASNDPPASTTPLPADEQEGLPSWAWLIIGAIAAAGLVGVIAYRRHVSHTTQDGR